MRDSNVKCLDLRTLIRECASFALSGSEVACDYAIDKDLWLADLDGICGDVLKGYNLFKNKGSWMPDPSLNCRSIGWVRQRLFGKNSFRTKRLGCVFGGWEREFVSLRTISTVRFAHECATSEVRHDGELAEHDPRTLTSSVRGFCFLTYMQAKARYQSDNSTRCSNYGWTWFWEPYIFPCVVPLGAWSIITPIRPFSILHGECHTRPSSDGADPWECPDGKSPDQQGSCSWS